MQDECVHDHCLHCHARSLHQRKDPTQGTFQSRMACICCSYSPCEHHYTPCCLHLQVCDQTYAKICIVRNLWTHLKETMRGFVIKNARYPRPVKTGLEKVVKFTFSTWQSLFQYPSWFFSYSLIPVLLQTFLFPFRTITAFAVYSFATFISTFLWKEQPPTIGKLILYLSSTTIAITFIFIIAVPFVSLYQLLVSGSFSDNPLILFGV